MGLRKLRRLEKSRGTAKPTEHQPPPLPFIVIISGEERERWRALSASNQPGVSMVTLATRKISRISSINVQTPPIAWLLRELENQINYHNVFFSRLLFSLSCAAGSSSLQEQINLGEQSEFHSATDRIKRERSLLAEESWKVIKRK